MMSDPNMQPAETLASEATGDAARIHPGTEGIWIFVFIDMIIFFLMFMNYVSERLRIPAAFAASQRQLDPFFGLANTLVLLTSSWAMVNAVRATRAGAPVAAKRWITVCAAFGALFCLNKLVEYGGKLAHGITPATDSFFAFYYVITLTHFLHVIGGLIFILHCRSVVQREIGAPAFIKKLENTGHFWHFVDAIWIFIFPLLYLAGLS